MRIRLRAQVGGRSRANLWWAAVFGRCVHLPCACVCFLQQLCLVFLRGPCPGHKKGRSSSRASSQCCCADVYVPAASNTDHSAADEARPRAAMCTHPAHCAADTEDAGTQRRTRSFRRGKRGVMFSLIVGMTCVAGLRTPAPLMRPRSDAGAPASCLWLCVANPTNSWWAMHWRQSPRARRATAPDFD